MSKVYVGKLGAEPLDERKRFSNVSSIERTPQMPIKCVGLIQKLKLASHGQAPS